jgi:hypothetical protein
MFGHRQRICEDIEKGIRIKYYKKETCGMTTNKMVQADAGRQQEERKELERN